MTSLPGRIREVTDCGLSFLSAVNNVRAGATSYAIHGHINDFLVCIGLIGGLSEL
ncbi:hypothetical protein Y59_06790 [Enterobacter hormaechei]|nr:hypothetical protein Y59_06790 [Enterobacter hormaechei]